MLGPTSLIALSIARIQNYGFLVQKKNLHTNEIYKKYRINQLSSSKHEKSYVEICSLIEYRMNETIQEIKKKDSIFESDILDSELRILDWILYQVCKDQQKNWERNLLGYQK